MNPSPHYGQRQYRTPIQQPGCGHLAIDNTRRSWWQSRARLRDCPQLVNLAQLAREIRRSWPA